MMQSKRLITLLMVALIFAGAVRAQDADPQPLIVICDQDGWAFVDAESTVVDDPCAAEIEQIRTTVRDRLAAFVDGNWDGMYPFLAMDYQIIDPFGGVHSKGQHLSVVSEGDVDYLSWEPAAEIQVRLYGDAAVVRFLAQMEIVVFGEESAGQVWQTELYEKIDGQWKLVWQQDANVSS